MTLSSLINRWRGCFGRPRAKLPLNKLFGRFSDDLWFWMNTKGLEKVPGLKLLLPGLPEENVQLRFTGNCGRAALAEAFGFYRLVKQAAQRHLDRPLSHCRLLDFGCGWGRIIRFFLKDLPEESLFGLDVLPEAIAEAEKHNSRCRFQVGEAFPPSSLPEKSFDLVYLFSVFSHLSEEAHLQWLTEFHRLLRPGGLVVATTRPREFIHVCAELRKDPNRAFYNQGAAACFPDTQAALADYDQGAFVFHPAGGGGRLEASFYGEACVSRKYVLDNWSKLYDILDYTDDRGTCIQNVIVARTKGN